MAALRGAEQQRGQAQQGLRDSCVAHRQEAGRQLSGQSTYVAPNGQHHMLMANGRWYPLASR